MKPIRETQSEIQTAVDLLRARGDASIFFMEQNIINLLEQLHIAIGAYNEVTAVDKELGIKREHRIAEIYRVAESILGEPVKDLPLEELGKRVANETKKSLEANFGETDALPAV